MDSPTIPRMTQQDFMRERLATLRSRRVPYDGTIELTRRCVFDCVHCYIVEQQPKGEMTTAEVIRILDDIAEAGCLFLLFTGGEILVRPDFKEIYLHAHRKGFKLTLYTAGVQVGPDLVSLLQDHPPWSIEITIYGANEETYARVTRRRGAFERVIRSVDLLLQANLPLRLKTVALSETVGELDRIRELTTSRGLKFRYDPMIQPRIEGNMAPCAHRLPPEEVVDLEALDPARAEAWRDQAREAKGMVRGLELFTCGAGVNSFHIDSRARLSVCTIVRGKSYDLRQGSFRDGWERWVPEIIERRLAPNHHCVGCKVFSYCESCPGWAAMETGSEDGFVQHACDVAHLRAKKFPAWVQGEQPE